jgi:hypothetical protein
MGRDYKGTICDKQTLDADILNAMRFIEKKACFIHNEYKSFDQ